MGADPRLAADLTQALRKRAAQLGYTPLPPERLHAAPPAAQGPQGITPQVAAQLVRGVGAERGVFASVSVEPGKYRLRIFVTTHDGDSEELSASATSTEIFGAADKLLAELLPEVEPPEPIDPDQPAFTSPTLRLAAGTEGAIGLSGAGFYNHLVHARLDAVFATTTSVGFELAYTNLKGRDGRAHNVLPSIVLEHAVDLGSGWSLPFSFSPGYLPKNGPVLQAAAGVAYAFDDSTELALTPIAPTAWITKDEAVYSLNLSAELRFGI